MSATLLNAFIVPKDRESEFLGHWKTTAAFFAKQHGFIETHLHRNTGVGDDAFSFINLARWESAEAWRSNHGAYTPGEYGVPGVKGHAAIFERVVEVYSETPPMTDHRVTLLNVFIVPPDSEAAFLKNWKETTAHFSKKSGFIETHLHRNAGVGNDAFRFINIARWESPSAWRTHHDDYKPAEYNVPGVKGHPAIFECIWDLYNKAEMQALGRDPFLRDGFFPRPAG